MSSQPATGNPIVAFAKITYLYTLAFIPSILGLYLYLPKPTGLGLISMWVAIPLDVISALLIMRLAAFGGAVHDMVILAASVRRGGCSRRSGTQTL